MMTLEEAVQLLGRRRPGLDPAAAEQIAVELDGLPLALEQAAAYLDRSGLSAVEYLALWRARSRDLHHRGHPDHHRDTIATLWQLSLDRLREESPAAVQLLGIGAHLAPEPIPLDLFTTHPDRLPQPLADAAADPLAFTDTVTAVVDYSLAKRTPTSLQLHRLVQDVIRASHRTPTPAGGPGMTPASPASTPGPLLTTAVSLLRADAPSEITGVPQAWPRWQALLPHVLALTLHPEDDPPTSPDGDTTGDRAGGGPDRLDVAWLLDHAATYLQVRGQPAAARPLAERALTITEAALGPDHPAVATALNTLALDPAGPGRAGRRPPAGRTRPDHPEAALGADHPDVATAPEHPRADPAGPGRSGRRPPAGRTRPDHRRGRPGPGPPHHRGHPRGTRRPRPGRTGTGGGGDGADGVRAYAEACVGTGLHS